MRRLMPVMLVLSLAAGAAFATEATTAAPDSSGTAAVAYGRLLTLAGQWETTTAKGSVIRLTFEPMARGSALVERYEAGPTVTQTVYHLDGARLLLTHYCAQGNQPRLTATLPGTGDRLGFTFLDATNIAGPDAARMIACEFVFEDGEHFTRSETYRGAKGDETTTRRYERAKVAP